VEGVIDTSYASIPEPLYWLPLRREGDAFVGRWTAEQLKEKRLRAELREMCDPDYRKRNPVWTGTT
jgi:hypothetical protein